MSRLEQIYVRIGKIIFFCSFFSPILDHCPNSGDCIGAKNSINTCSSQQLGLPSNPDSAVVGAANFLLT